MAQESIKFSLKEHRKNINRTFVCSICGKGFGRNSHLKRHVKSHESKDLDDSSHRVSPEPQELENSESVFDSGNDPTTLWSDIVEESVEVGNSLNSSICKSALENGNDSATLWGYIHEDFVEMENPLNSSVCMYPQMVPDVKSKYRNNEESLASRKKNLKINRSGKSVSDRKTSKCQVSCNSTSEMETESQKSIVCVDPSLVVDVKYECQSDEELLLAPEKIKDEDIGTDVASLFVEPVYESDNATCASAENDYHLKTSKLKKRKRSSPSKSARGKRVISLNEHKLNIVRNFICKICGKGFGRNSHLKRHVRGHAYKGDSVTEFALLEVQGSKSLNSERVGSSETEAQSGLNGGSSSNEVEVQSDDDQVLEVAVEQLESTSSVEENHPCSINNENELASSGEENEPPIVGDLDMGVDICDVPYADDAERVKELINEDKRFECSFCHKQYTQEAQYMKHLKLHKSLQQFECDLCGKYFDQKAYLKAHITTVHANKSPLEKVYECNMCYKSFGRRSHLKRHLKLHIEGKPFSCHVCGKCFGQSSGLKGHMKTHKKRSSSPGSDGMYKCHMCDKSYGRSSHLSRHMKTHTVCKKTTCDICGLCFAGKNDLEYHMKNHSEEDKSTDEEGLITTVGIQEVTDDHQCEVCGKSFKQTSSLKAHSNTVHGDMKTGYKDFECIYCGKQFGRNSHLKRHMKLHVGGDIFTCDLCGKSFKQNGNLKAHIRMVHLKERSFQCPYCGKKFLQKSNLDIHIRTHTGEKPYECLICGKDFVQGNQLKYHMRSHLGEKPYLCSVCGKRFSTSRACQNHKKTHEDDKASLDADDSNDAVEDPLAEEIVIVKEEPEVYDDEINNLESSHNVLATDNLADRKHDDEDEDIREKIYED